MWLHGPFSLASARHPSIHPSIHPYIHLSIPAERSRTTCSLTRISVPAAVFSHITTTAVKLDSIETPPPLISSPSASDRGRESTAESTPVTTPVISNASLARPKKERDLYFSWHRRSHDADARTSLHLESGLLFTDTDDSTFPLFPDSPPKFERRAMATSASSIDIPTGPRPSSTSPRPHTSNLTSQLRGLGGAGAPTSAINIGSRGGNDGRLGATRQDSMSGAAGSSYYGTGARPISVKGKPRRESMAGSLVNGMSWGGVSVGSWIRDE